MNEQERLAAGLETLQMTYTDKKMAQWLQYKTLLLEKNEVINLTAITDDTEVIVKHFLDSLAGQAKMHIADGVEVLDVGTGGGFPGVPLAIYHDKAQFTLLDSVRKKLTFIEEATKACGIENVTVMHERCEEAGHHEAYREHFDVVVSRAVAALPVLVELMLPFVRVGGFAFCMKGPDGIQEMEQAQKKIEVLGGHVVQVERVIVPFADFERYVIVIEKMRHTPKQYPRKPKDIAKDRG